MTVAVFTLACTSTGTSASLNAGAFTVLDSGTSFGVPVRSPVFGRVFDSESVNVAGAPVEMREQQLRICIDGSSMADLASKLDELFVLCDEITRKGGGTLAHTSTDGTQSTTFRVGVAQVGAPELMGAWYETAHQIVVTLALKVDPFGLGTESTVLSSGSVVFPRVLSVSAPGGTHDALASVFYTASSGVPSVMLYAWWPAVAPHNFMWNSNAEVVGSAATGAGSAYKWSAGAVSGVIAAATSVERITTGANVRSGTGAYQIVTPATTDTGASTYIARTFKAGTTYTASVWLRAAAGTTVARIKLGVSGDIQTGSSVALSTTWTKHTVTWTPATEQPGARFAIGVAAATATTFQFDDAMVYEGVVAPTCEIGGFGPGIIHAVDYNQAAASINGTAWSAATDTDYVSGFNVTASNALSTNGNLEYPILPHLFTPDDYTSDEVQLAVFARVEVASTQTNLACAISLAPDRGTSYGSRRYGSFGSAGKALKLPSSSTVFKPYFLGTITLRVDRTKPRREWLRLGFTNAGGATGTVGLDYLIVVPARSCARSMSGDSASYIPSFLAVTSSTKVIDHTGGGAIVEADGIAMTPDDGIGGSRPRIPRAGCELLVWPSDQIVDLTDSSAHNMAKTFTGTVVVKATPRHHLLKQA